MHDECWLMRRCAQSKLDESHDRRSLESRPGRAESSGGAEPLGVEDGEACRSLAGLPAVFRPTTVEAGSVRGGSSPRLRSDRRGGGSLHALHGHSLALHHFRERFAPFRLIVFTSVLLRVVAHAAFRFRNGRRRRRWVEHTWPKRHRRKCGGATHGAVCRCKVEADSLRFLCASMPMLPRLPRQNRLFDLVRNFIQPRNISNFHRSNKERAQAQGFRRRPAMFGCIFPGRPPAAASAFRQLDATRWCLDVDGASGASSLGVPVISAGASIEPQARPTSGYPMQRSRRLLSSCRRQSLCRDTDWQCASAFLSSVSHARVG